MAAGHGGNEGTPHHHGLALVTGHRNRSALLFRPKRNDGQPALIDPDAAVQSVDTGLGRYDRLSREVLLRDVVLGLDRLVDARNGPRQRTVHALCGSTQDLLRRQIPTELLLNPFDLLALLGGNQTTIHHRLFNHIP